MDCDFSPEQEALRDTVRRFLAERAPLSYVRSLLDDERGTTDEVWLGLAGLGVVGLLVPEVHGGAGMGMVDVGVVLEELGRAVHPGPFLSTAVAGASALTLVATDSEQAELLPRLAAGELTVSVVTGADVTVDGDGLSGTAPRVADAAGADLLLVLADGGLFAVHADAPGVDVTPSLTIDGTRKQATVSLSRATATRLGSGDATGCVGEVADRVLVAYVVDGVGAASAALDIAVAYAKERVQFGKPIGSFQAVAHLCADMLQAVELARAGAYYALWALDAAPAPERHRAATMAKAFASDALAKVGTDTIQVLGGIGFTWEHDAHLFYKRLLTLQHVDGGTTRHLEELAGLVL